MLLADRLIGQLSRKTSSTSFIPELDGLRFVAIAMVVAHHLSSYFQVYGAYAAGDAQTSHQYLFDFGARGVDLFFALSGFILAVPFARQALELGRTQPLRAYFLRRLTRLEPPLLFHLVVLALVHLAVTDVSAEQVGRGFLGHMFYASRVLETYRLNVVLWSLEVEAQFYVLAPVLALVYKLHGRGLRAAVFLGLGIGLHVGAPYVFGNADNFFTYALYFTVGMMVADFYVTTGGAMSRAGRNWVDWAVLGLLPVSLIVSNREWHPELVLPLHAGMALLAALSGGRAAARLRNPALVTIGGMCYTIYMYHYLMISVVGRATANWFPGWPYPAFFLAQLGTHALVIVTASAVLFRFMERPFMAVSADSVLRRLRGITPMAE